MRTKQQSMTAVFELDTSMAVGFIFMQDIGAKLTREPRNFPQKCCIILPLVEVGKGTTSLDRSTPNHPDGVPRKTAGSEGHTGSSRRPPFFPPRLTAGLAGAVVVVAAAVTVGTSPVPQDLARLWAFATALRSSPLSTELPPLS